MRADKNSVVTFHYTLHDAADAAGKPLDDSRERDDPARALLGRGQLVPGVESALIGREVGEKFAVDVAPADAYGDYQEGLFERVPKKYFRDAQRLKVGMPAALQTRDGRVRHVVVHKVGMTTIDVDHNHPLAGKTLHFDVEVLEVRDATPEEITHGHAHPGDGHSHE